MKFILASASPRRKAILELFNKKFITTSSDVDEKLLTGFNARINSMQIAYHKAKSISTKENSIILACDTVVSIKDNILGKPADPSEAKNMLSALSGNVHNVTTGFCIIDTTSQKCYIDYVETKVFFNKLSEETIDKYIACDEPYDKAGGYGIQGIAGIFVRKIDGDYFNVVGMPISRINEVLSEHFNYNIY